MATATASQAPQLFHVNPALSLHNHKPLLFKTRTLSLLAPPPPRSLSLRLRSPKPLLPKLKVSASTSIPTLPSNPPDLPSFTSISLLSDSTRTVSSLSATLLSVSRVFLKAIDSIASEILAKIQTLVFSIGPSSFAALKDRPSGYLNAPLTVVASVLAKWLHIYTSVLTIRILLSWFPNLPWERQPFSAIRHLCDPYLNLFRDIIPPIFSTLDVSPFLAFGLLGILSLLLKTNLVTH